MQQEVDAGIDELNEMAADADAARRKHDNTVRVAQDEVDLAESFLSKAKLEADMKVEEAEEHLARVRFCSCLLYTSPSPRD